MKARYYLDGVEIPEDQAVDARGIVKDGVTMSTSAFLRDSAGRMLTDAFGRALPANAGHRGYVFADDAANARREEAYATSKTALSSRWKGGLDIGDTMSYAGRILIADEWTGPQQLAFRDLKTLDGDALKEDARELMIQEMNDAWKNDSSNGLVAGEPCMIGAKRGTWQRYRGHWVCDPEQRPQQKEPDDREFEIAGPLSDSGQDVRDSAYAESVARMENAWKR